MADHGRHLWGAFCLGVVAVLELLSGRQDCVDHVIKLLIVCQYVECTFHWWSWGVHTCPELQTHRLVSC